MTATVGVLAFCPHAGKKVLVVAGRCSACRVAVDTTR